MGARLMTTTEVAKLLKLKAQTVRKWRSNNYGPPYFKVGRSVRYDRVELENWIERVDPAPQPETVKANKFGGPEMPKMKMKRTRFNLDVD